MTRKEAASKRAQWRLDVLLLAQATGSVTEACRRHGISRTQFYEYRRRFEARGVEGLRDLPPVHKSHPQTTPPEFVEKIMALSMENPAWGCARLSERLRVMGAPVSSPTIQKILLANDLGSRYQRLLRLEEKTLNGEMEPTGKQVEAIEQANPCYRERHVESSHPGELLAQDTFFVGHVNGIGKLYMQAVVDTYGSYAFGYLHSGKCPEHGAEAIHNHVMPQYEEWGIVVSAILTNGSGQYCGRDQHPFEFYLAFNDIEHRTTGAKRPQKNGFVERFRRTLLDEFLRPSLRQKRYGSIEALQQELDAWLKYYNGERPHRGYRNMGKRPVDTVTDYLGSVLKEGRLS